MHSTNRGFATMLVLLCVFALSIASGVYLFQINRDNNEITEIETKPLDVIATTTTASLESTSAQVVKQEDTTIRVTKKEAVKVVETKTTQVVLGANANSPEYTLTLASRALLTWQFGRDYVDITVQIDNHCTGRSCPTPPINFIARDLKNSGSFEWLVGDWMIAANGYVHGIMPPMSYAVTVRDSVTKEVLGNGKISIAAGEYSASYVTVLTPSGYGESVSRGSQYTIRWSTWPLKEFKTVRISLKNPVDCPPSAPSDGAETTQPAPFPYDGCVGSGKTYVIANFVPNTGSHIWRVGTDVAGEYLPSGNYKVIVEVPGQTYDESSGQFTVE